MPVTVVDINCEMGESFQRSRLNDTDDLSDELIEIGPPAKKSDSNIDAILDTATTGIEALIRAAASCPKMPASPPRSRACRQLQPNTPTSFSKVDTEAVLKTRAERAAWLDKIRNILTDPDGEVQPNPLKRQRATTKR